MKQGVEISVYSGFSSSDKTIKGDKTFPGN